MKVQHVLRKMSLCRARLVSFFFILRIVQFHTKIKWDKRLRCLGSLHLVLKNEWIKYMKSFCKGKHNIMQLHSMGIYIYSALVGSACGVFSPPDRHYCSFILRSNLPYHSWSSVRHCSPNSMAGPQWGAVLPSCCSVPGHTPFLLQWGALDVDL